MVTCAAFFAGAGPPMTSSFLGLAEARGGALEGRGGSASRARGGGGGRRGRPARAGGKIRGLKANALGLNAGASAFIFVAGGLGASEGGPSLIAVEGAASRDARRGGESSRRAIARNRAKKHAPLADAIRSACGGARRAKSAVFRPSRRPLHLAVDRSRGAPPSARAARLGVSPRAGASGTARRAARRNERAVRASTACAPGTPSSRPRHLRLAARARASGGPPSFVLPGPPEGANP